MAEHLTPASPLDMCDLRSQPINFSFSLREEPRYTLDAAGRLSLLHDREAGYTLLHEERVLLLG
jgi:hypothetical protein